MTAAERRGYRVLVEQSGAPEANELGALQGPLRQLTDGLLFTSLVLPCSAPILANQRARPACGSTVTGAHWRTPVSRLTPYWWHRVNGAATGEQPPSPAFWSAPFRSTPSSGSTTPSPWAPCTNGSSVA